MQIAVKNLTFAAQKVGYLIHYLLFYLFQFIFNDERTFLY